MMEDQDDQFPQDEQAIRDRIDDEITNHELMEHRDTQTPPHRPAQRGQTHEPPATPGGFLSS